ncbi:MAG: hypothetical protein ACKO2L_09085, partial [Planctomycetaceae bacterium]
PSSASIDSSELQKTQQKLPSESWTISSKGRGGIEGDFRPEAENFKAIGRTPEPTDWKSVVPRSGTGSGTATL